MNHADTTGKRNEDCRYSDGTHPSFEVDFVSGVMKQLHMCLFRAARYGCVQSLETKQDSQLSNIATTKLSALAAYELQASHVNILQLTYPQLLGLIGCTDCSPAVP